jgi:hypothetical protein
MDRHVVALFIPIMALAIPVAAIVMSGLQKVWRLRLEEARLRIHGGDSGSSEEVQALRSDLDTLQRQLSELNERVDFTERLLARGRIPDSSEQIRPPG